MENRCCEVPRPGLGWWSMPQGRPHENWEEASCSCGESPPNCTVTLHKRVLASGDKWVEQTMRRKGRCVPCGRERVEPRKPGKPGESPEDCFWRHYNAYTTPDQDRWFIGYEKACDLANRQCGTHHICNPCGVGPQGRPPTLSGLCFGYTWPPYEPLISDAELLRGAGCGPHGADKLAHCWLVCKVYMCYGPLGGAPAAIAAYLEDRYEGDPDDQLADAMGPECGNSLSLRPPWKPPAQSWTYECLDCCRKKTYDLLYRE